MQSDLKSMVFDAGERAVLAADPEMHPYADIRKDQVLGLLAALGEYGMRFGPEIAPDHVVTEPIAVQAHRTLLRFYTEGRPSPDSRPRRLRPRVQRSGSDAPVFNAEEQKQLAHDTSVGGHEALSKGDLLELLEALTMYERDAWFMELPQPVVQFTTRLAHSHNALLVFSHAPFTADDFSRSLNAVLRGEQSCLMPPARQPA